MVHRKHSAFIERIIELACRPEIENVVIDGFCGLGGVTEGFSRLKNWMVIFCINHWDIAIQTHEANHPDCIHLQEDFRTADLTLIKYVLAEIRKRRPDIKVHLWLSLECTNFSNAKGGMSRDADSRTLAEHADRYVRELRPDKIWIENVKEFLLWGPMVTKVISVKGKKKEAVYVQKGMDEVEFYNLLISNGHVLYSPLIVVKKDDPKKNKVKGVYAWMVPDPDHKGEDFFRWRDHICSLGFKAEHRVLNCADFGVPQHRIRLIMQFNSPNIVAKWPKKTHDRNGKHGLPKWNAVRDCLDLDDEGDSVLSFKMEKGKLVPRIDSDATIDRLISGALKHVIGKKEKGSFVVKYLSNNKETKANSGANIDDSSPTVTAQSRLGVGTAHMVDHYFGNGYMKSVDEPAGVTGTKDGAALHSLHYLTQFYSGNDDTKNISLDSASRAITSTGGNLALVSTEQFLGTYHSIGVGTSLDEVSPAQLTKDKTPLFTAHFIDHQYSNGQKNKSLDEPAGALVKVPKQQLVEVEHFVMSTQFNNLGHSIDAPAQTQTANRKHFYLVNFQWFNQGFKDICEPANTIISRMDKAPNYLIVLETGDLAIEVFEHDPPHYVRLKKFMADYGIVKINMRMLKDGELLKIMTIRSAKKLSKSSTNNKKMIGNAVPSDLIEHLGAADSPITAAAA